MIRGRLIVAIATLALVSGACGGEANPNQVQVVDNAFSPRTTTIQVGTTVNWSWNGQAPHNVVFTAGSGIPSSSILNSPASYSAQFSTPGTYTYECTLHSGMTGTIIVK